MQEKKWNELSPKVILDIEKSYFYFLKCFLCSKGFVLKNKTFKKEDGIFNGEIFIECLGRTIGIRYLFLDIEKKLNEIFLNRYVLYPQVISHSLSYTLIPYPSWGYGFVEAMISTFDSFLLDDIIMHNGTFENILLDNNLFKMNLLSNSDRVITNNLVQEETNRLLEIPFKENYLTFEIYKNKENPFRHRNLKVHATITKSEEMRQMQ